MQTAVWVCFLEKKRKRNIVWQFAKMFVTMVGVELLEGYERAVCDTCRYSIFWENSMENISLNFSSLVSDSGLPYNRDFWFGAIARKGACTVMSR